MKKIAISIIHVYQIVISPFLKTMLGVTRTCRYPVTCSEYTIKMIEKYGMIRGGYRGLKRLLTCNPFSNAL